jgi:hypothetical protein
MRLTTLHIELSAQVGRDVAILDAADAAGFEEMA